MHPSLAQVYAVCVEAGLWVGTFDARWRCISMSDDLAAIAGETWVPNEFLFGSRAIEARLRSSSSIGLNALEDLREHFRLLGGWLLTDLPGGRDALRQMVHPMLADLVDELESNDTDALAWEQPTTSFGERLVSFATMFFRVHDDSGGFVGGIFLSKPTVPMQTLFTLAASGDVGHLERMQQLSVAGRRPAAILFADLEGSSPLAKRLPTATYFSLVRRLTGAFDQCVIDAGGLVGRHVGDGVVAFFVAETAGSESGAARACLGAARSLQVAASEVAVQHDLRANEFVVRAGLHWGTTLYVGSIITTGRSEVTALGDEVNEAARIEACATGGRLLCSKQLIERLEPEDALGIDPNRVTYTPLAELDTATDKARRDAPAIPVHDVAIRST